MRDRSRHLYFWLLCLWLAGFYGLAHAQNAASAVQMPRGLAPIVDIAAPAVVNIYAKRIVATRSSPFADHPFFQDFFHDFGAPQKRVQNSLGSGVILTADGYAVSNYHVVGQATDIRVVLKDRREFAADVVLGDEESDLAILRLREAKDLPILSFRDSDAVEVGELVLAIGNPFGVGQTVSSGIVSGLARSGMATGQARGFFIQTDAPINPGNSGGALVDMAGRLVGVNTSILTRSGGSNGIGFAIPADLVHQFLQQAKAGQRAFARPWAGLAGQSVDADIAQSLELALPEGILISQVHPQSAFATAGVQTGDIITKVDDIPIYSPAEMLYRMSVKGLGNRITIERLRNGDRDILAVVLAAAPEGGTSIEIGDESLFAGLSVADLGPQEIIRYDLPILAKGVIIQETGRAGARVGLRPGDIFRRINHNDIERAQDVATLLQKAEKLGRFEFLLERGGQRVSLRFRR